MTKQFLEEIIGLKDQKQIDDILTEFYLEEMEKEDEKEKGIVLHCKPCANFQTVEFDYVIADKDDEDGIADMLSLFTRIQSKLSTIGCEQTVVTTKKKEYKEELATDKQLRILNRFYIPYEPGITKREAQKLIAKSYQSTHDDEDEE